MRRDGALLGDLLTAADDARRFIVGMDEDSFIADEIVRCAVAYQLVIMGEAANRLSTETRARSPEVPWAAIVGLRNRVIHGYFAVDWTIVYDVVRHELPELIEEIRSIGGSPGGEEE